jgi:hypothetical protein
MLNLVKTFVLLSTILIIGGASGSSGKSFDSAMGEWSWQYEVPSGRFYSGKMTIIDETKATYTFNNGRILFYAVDDQGKWEGYWVEDPGAHGCSDKKDGSYNWGVAIFQFNDAYNKFRGKYDFCGEGSRFSWSAVR